MLCAAVLASCAAPIPERVSAGSESVTTAVSMPVNVSYSSLLAEAQADNSLKLAYGNEPLQFGRLYLPPETTTAAATPLLVFIHGGCWLNAYDMVHSTAFSQAVAKAGIAVWSLEYRRSGDAGGGWPGSLDDVLAGLAFARQNLATLVPGVTLDQHNIVLAGHSAGGQLALLAGAQQQGAQRNAVRGVIGLAAITNLLTYAQGGNSCQRATTQFMAGTPQQWPGRYLLASPAMQPAPAKSLLLQGSNDSIVPVDQASDSGMPYRLVEEAGHFDWIHPQTKAYTQFLATLMELVAQ